MSRDRNLASDLWTREALVACKITARYLFVAMQNFADDHGVQPLRPCTIRLQVFPGDDDIDDAQVQAMLEELASCKLLRIYEVEGQAYALIVDWANLQRVNKRARRRYPADPSMPQPEPPPPPLPLPVPTDALEHAPPEPAPLPARAPSSIAAPERWRRMIKNLLRQYWPRHPLIELMDDDAADRWTAKWIAQGCDFQRDILPVVRDFCRMKPFCGPPVGFQELDEHVGRNRAEREVEIYVVPSPAREPRPLQDSPLSSG